MSDKNWEHFVEESRKVKSMWDDETKFFDAIMDAGAAARIQGVEFTYRKYIKEEQMERFNERLKFRTFLLKMHNENDTKRGTL